MPTFQLSRRRAIVLGAGAVAALTGLYPALRQLGSYPEPQQTFEHLGPKTAAIYGLLGDFLAPPSDRLPGSGGDAKTLARIDRMLGAMPERMRMMLLALPLAFEHATALDRYGARSLSHLPPERQVAFLTEWAQADDLIRAQLFMALRSVVGQAYFEREEVMAAMHVAPGCS